MGRSLTLDMSGSGVADFALPEVKELAQSHGLELDAFFSAYGVKALSTFRKKFAMEALQPPTPRVAAPTGLATARAKADWLKLRNRPAAGRRDSAPLAPHRALSQARLRVPPAAVVRAHQAARVRAHAACGVRCPCGQVGEVAQVAPGALHSLTLSHTVRR